MFRSEKEMQNWLSQKLKDTEGLSKLIIDHEFKPDFSHKNKKIIDSYNYCLETLRMTKVVCEDKDISQFPGETLKPDFLLYSLETESFVIVELKNIAGPTRQAATELSAYANAVKSYFPGISDGDIINVIVSNEWPTLIRNFIFNEIYWLNRNIVCLKPVNTPKGIRLECINPSEFTSDTPRKTLTPDSFSGYQLCLYGDKGNYANNIDYLENNFEQIRSSFYRITNKSNQLHSHGFAFLWRDFRRHSIATYNITIVDTNPFEKNLYETCGTKGIAHELQQTLWEYEATGNTYSLFEVMKGGDFYLKSICSAWPEGASKWENLKKHMTERAELIEFRCWGVVAEIYETELAIEYDNGNINTKYECPVFGLNFVEERLFTSQ